MRLELKIFLAFVLVGCGGLARAQEEPEGAAPATATATPPSPDPAKAISNEAKKELAPEPVQTTPITPSMEAFVYDPTGKRDPFQPPETAIQSVLPTKEKESSPVNASEPRTLESFDLSQLRVAAIIWETKVPRAMIIDPDGKMHYVKVKTRLGRNGGYVVAIREREVVVIESTEENGQITKSFKILEL